MIVLGLLRPVKSGFQLGLVCSLFLLFQRGIKRMEQRQMLYVKVDVEYVIPVTRANFHAQHVFKVLKRRLIYVMLIQTEIASRIMFFVEILVKFSRLE